MTLGICDILGDSVFGIGERLNLDEVSLYIRENIIENEVEQQRVRRHRKRQEMYQDGGELYMRELIEKVIKDPCVQDLREQWVNVAGFNNVVRRIVNERSTVYQEPAVRHVEGDENNKRYSELQVLMRQHERSRQWNRLSNLHRTILVGVRVRNIGSLASPIAQPVFDIITPAEIAGLITSPKDPTRLEGALIEIKGVSGRKDAMTPKYVLWTNAEKAYLDEDGRFLEIVEHEIGRMPLVLLRLEEDTGSLFPGQAGQDLIRAQEAIWFTNTCLMKETKSANKQVFLAGDLTPALRNQSIDTELAAELPEGTVAEVRDMSMDLSLFTSTANHILDTVASNYGISSGVLRHQGVQSAEARDLMRVPIRELRLEQQAPLREFERELAEVQRLVMLKDAPQYAFETEGWSIEFADPQTPRGVMQQLEQFERARKLSLTSTVNHITQSNPDIDRCQAEEIIQENINDEIFRAVLQRPLNEISGAVFGGTPPNSTGEQQPDAEVNGRLQSDDSLDGRLQENE